MSLSTVHAADTVYPPLGLADPAMAQAQLERVTADFGRMYRERNEALLRLSIAGEFRDDDTGVHIVRMGFLAEALGLAMGQGASWSCLLRMAAPMHDVGKIGVPAAC
jgi:putative two-component system response regulator